MSEPFDITRKPCPECGDKGCGTCGEWKTWEESFGLPPKPEKEAP